MAKKIQYFSFLMSVSDHAVKKRFQDFEVDIANSLILSKTFIQLQISGRNSPPTKKASAKPEKV